MLSLEIIRGPLLAWEITMKYCYQAGLVLRKQKMNRMYIVTREDLEPGYQAVQSCHAVSMLPNPVNWDGHMILLSTRNEETLTRLFLQASSQLDYCKPFHEPDVGYQMTAFAAMVPEEKQPLFRDLPLALRKKKWFRRFR